MLNRNFLASGAGQVFGGLLALACAFLIYDGMKDVSNSQSMSTAQAQTQERSFHYIDLPDGNKARINVPCDITRDSVKYVVIRMMRYQVDAALECEGEEISAARYGSINQSIVKYPGRIPGTGVIAVFERNKLVQIEKQF